MKIYDDYPFLTRLENLFENRYHKIYRVKADFGTFFKEYFVNDHGERAGVVILHEDSVLLVRQYRLLINDISLEIPGGALIAGENPLVGAKRECLEETGISCHDLKPLLNYQLGMDTSKNPTYLFYTDSFDMIPQKPPMTFSQETLDHLWMPIRKCLSMIFDGSIQDSFTILAILSYHVLIRKNY